VKVAVTEQADETFEVWDMNWPAVEAFLALQTQWRTVAMSTLERARVVRLGLDYAAIPPVMDLLKVKKRKRVFEQLMVLESAALVFEAELAA
jgi:hypothetical protein